MEDKAEKTQKLVEMTAEFCNIYLDEEYKQLCEKLIKKMSRKRKIPFLSGRLEIWAASIIYALGQINCLFDTSFKPHATAKDICNYFGVSRSTTSQKAKTIRNMFKLMHWDREFSTKHMKEGNPFSKLVMVDGLIYPIESLPPNIQKIIQEKRR